MGSSYIRIYVGVLYVFTTVRVRIITIVRYIMSAGHFERAYVFFIELHLFYMKDNQLMHCSLYYTYARTILNKWRSQENS